MLEQLLKLVVHHNTVSTGSSPVSRFLEPREGQAAEHAQKPPVPPSVRGSRLPVGPSSASLLDQSNTSPQLLGTKEAWKQHFAVSTEILLFAAEIYCQWGFCN